MAANTPFDKIIWALDPFSEDKALLKRVGKTLSQLKTAETMIIPVGVIHALDRFDDSPLASTAEKLTASGVSVLAKKLDETGFRQYESPEILLEETRSLGAAIAKLLAYAKKEGVDLICVASQTKLGTTRFLLGSFTETLILQSDLPVLVVSPSTKSNSPIKRILFPTDLTEKSKDALRNVAPLAKALKVGISLVHVTPLPAPKPRTKEDPMHEALLQQSKEELEKLGSYLKATGVSYKTWIEHSRGGTAETLIKLASAPGTLLAMVSQTAPVYSRLLGSVTRQVIRYAPSPVWVIHPRRGREADTATERSVVL